MARDPNIPLFLWVAAAIVAHLVWGGGAEQVSEVFEEQADVRRFAASVQQQLRRRFSTEIALLEDTEAEPVQRDAEEADQPPVADAPLDPKPAEPVEPPKQPVPERTPPDDAPAPEREKLKAKVEPEPQKITECSSVPPTAARMTSRASSRNRVVCRPVPELSVCVLA